MTGRRGVLLLFLVVAILAVLAIPSLPLTSADTSVPLNYVPVNFSPFTSTVASNYDFGTGAMSPSDSTVTLSSTVNLFEAALRADPPADPNGYGTFIGTAHPTKNPVGAVLYEQSVCEDGYPTCLSDGSLTYGYMVMYTMRGDSLGQLTNLATLYYIQTGCFGGGSPRFSIAMSDGSEVHVYLGTGPEFTDCLPANTWVSTGNLATDAAGLRWDTSQICPGTFYNTYSGAVACADGAGLTISEIFLATDGGWSGANAGNPWGQTFLFQQIQVNDVTRFP